MPYTWILDTMPPHAGTYDITLSITGARGNNQRHTAAAYWPGRRVQYCKGNDVAAPDHGQAAISRPSLANTHNMKTRTIFEAWEKAEYYTDGDTLSDIDPGTPPYWAEASRIRRVRQREAFRAGFLSRMDAGDECRSAANASRRAERSASDCGCRAGQS